MAFFIENNEKYHNNSSCRKDYEFKMVFYPLAKEHKHYAYDKKAHTAAYNGGKGERYGVHI